MPSDLQDSSFLRRRLVIALATPIVILLLLGGVLGRQILLMTEDAELVDTTDQIIRQATEIKLGIVDQETSLRGYLITEDPVFLEPFERASPLMGFARLDEVLIDPNQRVRFAEAKRRYEAWLELARPLTKGEGLAEGRTPASMQQRRQRMDAVRESLRAAIDAAHDLRRDRAARSAESTDTTSKLFVGLVVAAALALGWLSRRQLGAIASTFQSALDAEVEARRASADEAWIRQGHAKVGDALLGEKTTHSVASDGLTTLAAYAEADIGAFFVRDGAGWKRAGAFALDDAGDQPDAEGLGLVRRAESEGKVLVLGDLPPGYLHLRSGTGDAAPEQVVLIPAAVDGLTYAVVELGYIKPIAPRTRELFERIGETLALAVRSAEYKTRLRELLEETQRQGEELQTQQEELKVQNEELEQQTKVLQDSQVKLSSQQAELEQINSQLEEQTQALVVQRDDLARAQTEVQRASAYKSEFLANMSHELRTPLNSSLILAKLLADNREGNLSDEQIKYAQTIYSAGNDLLTLINDILDLSKIEAGKLDVRTETVAVQRVVDELSTIFQPVAKEKKLALTVEIGPGVPDTIVTDPTRLQQILKNLLSNALKFTEQGGVIVRVGRRHGGMVAFEVQDTGIGIPETQQGVIFEAFRQADGRTNRKYGGTGLGLSISRDLSQLLGGDLSVESTPGRGSTFTLVLPAHHEPKQQAAVVAADPVPAPRPRAPKPAPSNGQPAAPDRSIPAIDDRATLQPGARSLLIIEDDLPFARVLQGLAKERDFAALLAPTGEEGLELAERFRPSAIVLDVGLPDRSGLSVLDALKHRSATRHIPVHMVSASDHVQTALEMGATGYAIKPIEREKLVEALSRLESKFTQAHRRILVVEDDDRHRESTCKLLAADDIETVAVGTAAAALEKLKSSTFDCMVLDLSLPDRTGLDLLEEMSQKEQYGFPPVIVYTGRSLSREEEHQLRRFSRSIIIKGARSPERLLDEVTLFLHKVESDLPPERQRMLRDARHREAVFEGKRILVVEDDVRNVFALASLLEPKGAKVEIARNGREALDKLSAGPAVDLVLMDVMMPEMDGLQATRAIRARPDLAKLPVIALTAKAMTDDRENCLAAGANDYIAKPLDIDKLLSLVRVWMPK